MYMMIPYFKIILLISFFLLSVRIGPLLCSTGNKLDEGKCEGLQNCVCMNITGFFLNRTKLICENEINIDASSSIYLHPVRFSTILKVLCVPYILPKLLLKDYYNLLHLKLYYPEFHILSVVSCPEPPNSYASFIYPPSSILQDNIQLPTLNLLNIHCGGNRIKFSLQRKHLSGFQILKELKIICHTMIDLPGDIFYDTSPSMTRISIESTQVSSVYANTFSPLFRLHELSMRKNSIISLSGGTFNNLTSLRKLDLSHNSISELNDDTFQDNRDLVHLNLSYNSIISLPKSISGLVNLTVLDVSYNSLEEISLIKGLHKLEKLWAHFNKLIYVNTEAIASLKSVKYIYLSGNSVLNLDPIQFPLNNLYDFVFSHNSQATFHIEPFLSGDSIEDLIFSNSSIVSIHPGFLEKIPSIKSLDLSKNKLTTIPEDIFVRSKGLYTVILRENYISELLPNTFSNNPELERLDLSSNKLSNFHDNIFSNNHELRYLDISNNKLTALSNILFHNTSLLVELNAADNQLTVVHPALLSTCRRVSWLDFSGNLLEQISEDIFSPLMERLFNLNLARNCISSLPLLKLDKVRKLNLSHNCLEYIQENLFQGLVSLDKLDLSYNRIKNISNSPLLAENVSMTLLDLSNNHLSHIPDKILSNKLILIDSINFSGNAMTRFYFNCIVKVKALVELNLASNRLSYFGLEPNVEHYELMTSIRVLDLSNNSLDFKEARWYYDEKTNIWGKVTDLIWFQNLEVLLLSNNSISSLFLEWRDDLTKLRLLDLRYNKILRLQHHDILFFSPHAPRQFPLKNTVDRMLHPRLNNTELPYTPKPPLTVDLRGNLIQSVDIPLNKVKKLFLDRNGSIPEGIYGHATLLLDENPFSCDCSMLNFLRIVQNDVAPISSVKHSSSYTWFMPARIEVGNLSCWEPKSIRGSLISEPETWIHHILPLISLCSLTKDSNFNQ